MVSNGKESGTKSGKELVGTLDRTSWSLTNLRSLLSLDLSSQQSNAIVGGDQIVAKKGKKIEMRDQMTHDFQI
jgi:hypothetical protein